MVTNISVFCVTSGYLNHALRTKGNLFLNKEKGLALDNFPNG